MRVRRVEASNDGQNKVGPQAGSWHSKIGERRTLWIRCKFQSNSPTADTVHFADLGGRRTVAARGKLPHLPHPEGQGPWVEDEDGEKKGAYGERKREQFRRKETGVRSQELVSKEAQSALHNT